MIVILQPSTTRKSEEFTQLMAFLSNLPGVTVRVHEERGSLQTLTELYLVGNTATLSEKDIAALPGVERVVRVSQEYRILGRHKDDHRPTGFDYNGVHFGQDNLNLFAGLCAVNTPEDVETMMKALQENGQVCTRMGPTSRAQILMPSRVTVRAACPTSSSWRGNTASR